ncbi:serine hydrolase domain-containing protein [Promicromonospora sukumoe]|uniref:serine hydrolase domain-containing protein n=1 Tax=Promicromonospora sukumoe TaxID=88382 RepID=UPI00037CA584|nr:serine hydrolase domain-containing protein [Promicromonospora sukumoe]
MFSTHDHTPTERPGGAPPRRARRALATLGVLTALALAGAPAATAAEQPTPPPPVSAPSGEHDLVASDVDAWLDGLLPAALESAGIAGGVVTVVDDGEILTTRGYGHADTGTTGGDAVPVDAETTLFRPGSVSKLFTATAVMQLVESGDLDLDTDVAEYLDFDVPRRFDDPITLRNLLTHTAGFEERVGGLIGFGDQPVVLRDVLAQDPPEQVYAPGTVPAYSNYGNALAGYVVERVSGVPFEEYVERNIFEPAGMTSSTFVQPLPGELTDRMSQGYTSSDAAPGQFEIVGTAPAGSLTSSAPDMARFMLAQLGAPGAGPILEPGTLDLMHAPALDESTLGGLAAAPRMALGFFDESRNGHTIVGHGGDTQFFHSHLQLYPDEGTGIFISLNSSGTDGFATVPLREAVLQGFTDRYFPADDAGSAGAVTPAPGTTVDQDTAREHAALAEGTYVSSRGVQSNFLTVLDVLSPTQLTARADGRLLITPGPGAVTPALYEEVEPWVWREVDGQRTLAMRVADGQVEAIVYEGAFTLLPGAPERAPGVVLPVLGVSALILLVAAVAWPVGAIRRRVRKESLPQGTGRVTRILTKVAAIATVLALAGWAITVQTVMGLQEVPEASLRQLQVVQALGALGIIPAVLQVVGAVRHRHGWRRVAGTVLVVLALAAAAWYAVDLRLLAPSVSY